MTTDTPLLEPASKSCLAAALQHCGSVAQAQQNAEVRVRQQPGAFAERWQLFQWLCVMGDWPRALKQLQVATQLMPDFAQTAHVYRDLIRAEVFRADVIKGAREPGALLPSPDWMTPLRNALTLAEAGDTDGADHYRQQALSEVPDRRGALDGSPFAWITDSDTRFGPTCEIVSGGRYAWLPFSQLHKLAMGPVVDLLDLVWRSVTVTLAGGTVSRGFTPVRYPGSERGSDALQLARETQWSEVGQTGIVARGQKTWMTSAGDVGLLDVSTLVIGDAHE
ncbi:type VI secretion system accessory protein TagJ [Ralstonia wenshanensis]|uniref:type VI secretion system accessory protein TagJ n=1 Tax=Ralstonia wenshanensis TaxID=2842456 RepID=UPI0021B17A87|nr:type VI secretion system accessory protein TagJ [Ralstonia wenshanensis]MCT7306440.1 ImpE protein superfamily protein [Ralstonia wenshanensis]